MWWVIITITARCRSSPLTITYGRGAGAQAGRRDGSL